MIAIYQLRDPRTGAVRYIGKTNNPRKRASEHRRGKSAGVRVGAWLAELLAAGLAPIMETIAEVAPEQTRAAERAAVLANRDADLLNTVIPGNRLPWRYKPSN